MPRGLPDYYNPDTVVSQRVVDLSVIISSLSGVTPVDGRGRVIFSDHFSEGLSAFLKDVSGGGVAGAVCDDYSFIPPVSCKLHVDIAGAVNTTQLTKRYQFNYLAGAGIEISVYPGTRDFILYLGTSYLTPSGYKQAQVQFTSDVGEWALLTGGVYQTILTSSVDVVTQSWNRLKLVADYNTGFYTRLIVNDGEIQLDDIPLHTNITTGKNIFSAVANHQSATLFSNDLYIGHVIITLDEP